MDTLPHLSGHPGIDMASLEEVSDSTVTGKMRITKRINVSFMAIEVWWSPASALPFYLAKPLFSLASFL
jgi:hypothetical protein